MAQKTMCDFCKKNEADKNFKIMEKYQIWGPFYGDDWKHIDICTECYEKLFGVDTSDKVDGNNKDLMEYKERVLEYFNKVSFPLYPVNDRIHFMRLVRDILDERYDRVDTELLLYNKYKESKDT